MWQKLRGSKTLILLIGMLIGGVLVGCGAGIQQATASGNGYLTYKGSNTIEGDEETKILSYSKPNSNQMIYVIQSSNKTVYKYNIASAN